MARSTDMLGGAYRVAVTVEWDDDTTTTYWYGPYDAYPTAAGVLTRKTNPRYFADYTRWNPPTPRPVRATGHVEEALGWVRVDPPTAAAAKAEQ